jgi:hypothetical protein
VPASYLHQFSAMMQKIPFYGAFLGQFFIIFGANLSVARLPFFG